MPTERHDPGGEHVERSYDGDPQREWDRMERHRTEYAITMRALREHLPSPPARVLDCGGGPGRFSIALAGLGHEVTLFDLSAENLSLARDKAARAGVTLTRYDHGTATDLSRYPDESYDAVLLMGPLYHLLIESNRRQALREVRRVLRPGGTLFAAFVTRYAPLRYAAAHDLTWPQRDPGAFEAILAQGLLPPRGEPGSAFVAYLSHPREVPPLLRDTGFEVVALLGVEGLVSMIEEGVNQLQGADWDRWVDLNYRASSDPSIYGCVEHLLAVALKPRWQSVLCRITRTLKERGLAYKVVGGTAVALQGVPIHVADIDLEMDVQGAYRFQRLFADCALQPVAFREGEVYRSHFGRFAFHDVEVEVMGELDRREGDAWMPSMTCTETHVDLDGVPIRVSWLEEETLAYVRRGRLERAAQCLPHCDREKLLALLRGEQGTGVI